MHIPVEHPPDGPLCIDNRCYNRLITALRAPAERSNVLLGRWRALDRVTSCPQRSGVAAAAALVLTSLARPRNEVRRPHWSKRRLGLEARTGSSLGHRGGGAARRFSRVRYAGEPKSATPGRDGFRGHGADMVRTADMVELP